ncbi:ShlB/FhaC/HecB family hemolysin secretion/activation protein [Nitrospirillum sp. BR 11752]|uniref:ShlB/FhaC/HecB family hemolysin secretion/activation protein n=1 Tax=Nitrospirillum sp. BR 11752 TaxID=3104293 RepID=UPI002E9F98BD|nr:ShlB/FhaC/HecB family hemolysin secretion/activation protein [Nitrospirillum sp. BR 11752]
MAVIPPVLAKRADAQDTGQILRDVERNIPREAPRAPTLPDLAPPPPDGEFLKAGETVHVTGFRFIATLIPESELRAQLTSYVGRDCTLGDLREAAARISRYYAQHDYLARAVLPRQDLEGGVVTIQVLEARMGRVLIDPSSEVRLDADQAQDFIYAQNAPGDPLRPSAVATGVSNLGLIPGMQALGVLDAGADEGTTDIHLKMREPPLVTGTTVIDNNAPREIGGVRGLILATMTDAAGVGDQVAFTGQVSQSSKYGQMMVGAPVWHEGLWLEASGAVLQYDVPADINASTPSGDAQTAALTLRWLALRSSAAPVNLAFGLEHKWTSDKLVDVVTASNRLGAMILAAHRLMRDDWQGGGAFTLDAQVKAGNVDLSHNAANQAIDQATARTAGHFVKATASISRAQVLWRGGDALVTLAAQIASKNLNSSEQFSLGGPSGVRAYPLNQGGGDQGAMLNIEIGQMVSDSVRFSAFWDGGWVEQHKTTWGGWEGVGSPHNHYVLQGVGASVQWTPASNVQMKATVARRIGSDAGRNADGLDLDGRRRELRAWMQMVLSV